MTSKDETDLVAIEELVEQMGISMDSADTNGVMACWQNTERPVLIIALGHEFHKGWNAIMKTIRHINAEERSGQPTRINKI